MQMAARSYGNGLVFTAIDIGGRFGSAVLDCSGRVPRMASRAGLTASALRLGSQAELISLFLRFCE
jgi:hypothetical protein